MLVLICSLLAIPTTEGEATPPNCSCVEFVKGAYGIFNATGDAKNMGAWLLNHGFSKVSSPRPGAVAVMQPTFPGANTTYGHVGVITKVTDLGSKWQIVVRGSNQSVGSSLFTEFGCSNVRDTTWGSYNKTDTRIAYYYVKRYAIRSSVTKSGYSPLYFDVNNSSKNAGAYIIGWTYHGATNQMFNFIKYGTEYRLIARISGMCVQPSSTSQGARLVQKTCTGNAIEKWQRIYTSTGYILKNSYTGYVADLNNGSLKPGNSILVWSSHNGANQRWWLDPK